MNETTRKSSLPWLNSNDEVLLRIHAQLERLASIRLPTPLAAWTPRNQELRGLIEVAFWSSLLTNEERPTRVRITLAPRDLVPETFALESAVDYDEAQVAKLAHAIPPYGSLLVCPEGDRLQIWGFSGTVLGGGIDGITAEIAAPGIVRVNIHMLRPYAVFKGRQVFFVMRAGPSKRQAVFGENSHA